MKLFSKYRVALLVVLGGLVWHAPSIVAETAPEGILDTEGVRFSASIDWESKELSILVSAPVDRDVSVRNRATLMSRKENELREFFPTIFPLCLHGLRINSLEIFQDLMAKDPQFSLRVKDLASFVQVRKSQPSGDLKSISIEYRLPFAPGINSLFIEQHSPRELPRLLAWQPSANYTGLIIHVDDLVDWYGTDTKTSLVPSLFPRLLDEDARLLLDLAALDPAAAQARGTVNFTTANANNHYPLAGSHPLVVNARGLFGDTPTDLMISRAEADILLYNDQTRNALRQGKVVVVVNPKFLHQDLVR